MENETSIYVDPKRISELVESGRLDSDELGEELRKVVKLLLCSGEFRMFTEDWKLEMASAAYVSLYNALGKLDLATYGSPFNFLYTVARRSLRKEAERLKRREEREAPFARLGYDQNVSLPSFKRASFKHVGISVDEERSLIGALKHRPANLRNLVGRMARRFSEQLSTDQTRELTEMFHKMRESWTRPK